jgi:ABC-type uncharacterized transport system ATPase subunit
MILARDYKVRRDLLVERFELGDFIDTPVNSLGQRMRRDSASHCTVRGCLGR